MNQIPYEHDYHAWALDQARRLRAGEPVDAENIAEELEDLGRAEQRQLRNRLAVLLTHMLKWEFQPDKRTPSWAVTMKEQRRAIARLLNENPSLKPKIDECIEDAYSSAVIFASLETAIIEDDFPQKCAYTIEEVLMGEEERKQMERPTVVTEFLKEIGKKGGKRSLKTMTAAERKERARAAGQASGAARKKASNKKKKG